MRTSMGFLNIFESFHQFLFVMVYRSDIQIFETAKNGMWILMRSLFPLLHVIHEDHTPGEAINMTS